MFAGVMGCLDGRRSVWAGNGTLARVTGALTCNGMFARVMGFLHGSWDGCCIQHSIT